jgi:hypothetical protein
MRGSQLPDGIAVRSFDFSMNKQFIEWPNERELGLVGRIPPAPHPTGRNRERTIDNRIVTP